MTAARGQFNSNVTRGAGRQLRGTISDLLRRGIPGSWSAVLVLFVLLCLAKCFYISGFSTPFVWGDSYLYANRAYNLARAGSPTIENFFGPSYPPLYSVFLAPAWLVTRDPEGAHRLMLLINIVLNSSLVFPLFLLGRKFFGRRNGLLIPAVALGAILPAVAAYSFSIMAENLYIPLLAWVMVVLLRYLETPSQTWALLLGLGTGAVVLTKSFGLVMVPVLIFGLALAPADPRRKLVSAAACFAGLAAPILAWQLLAPPTPAAVASYSEDYRLFAYLGQMAIVFRGFGLVVRFIEPAAGQLSYLILGSFLLLPTALIGEGPGTSALPQETGRNLRSAFGILIAASLVLSVLHSMVQFSFNPARYALMPRYLDPLMPLIVALGVPALASSSRWPKLTAAATGVLGVAAAITIPCVSFGVVDRMSLGFITSANRYLACRPALILLALSCIGGILVTRRPFWRAAFLAGVACVAIFGTWTSIRAERSLSRYHERQAASARWVADQIEPGHRLVLDLRNLDPSQQSVRSEIWRLLYECRPASEKNPMIINSSRGGLIPETTEDVFIIGVSCLLEAGGDNLESCLYTGPFGDRPDH